MKQNIINTVEEAVTNAGGIDMYVKKLFHHKSEFIGDVQKLRVSVTVSSNEVNSFLICMNEKFSKIEFSRVGVVIYADSTPVTEEWEIEVTLIGDNM